jgi:Na+-translocating ferredoxin:NAD+ oxidoreductase subunit C
LKTFRLGGVHPAENKLTADKPIQQIPLPSRVFIPLSQSLGAPSKIIVEKGEVVRTGQIIARGESFISSNIHSSVSGKVIKVEDITDTSGYKRPTVVIEVEGDDWVETIDRSDKISTEIPLSGDLIISRIKDLGVVGLGGATFPSHVKLMTPKDKKAEVLIINGVECEPYLTADHRIMLERGEEIVVGTRLLMIALNVEKAFIGIENNKPDAISAMMKLTAGTPDITVVPLKVKYPQGGEKQLIKAITGKEVPSGKLPIETGCIVYNVGTALAVYEAVQKNKPLIERVVTVTGSSLSNPGNFLVRIGTPVEVLVQHAGGLPDDTGKVISGGPMMGKSVSSIEVPVVKGTSGILIMPQDKSRRVPVHACIRCGRCIAVCPMGLQPVNLSNFTYNEMYDEAEKAFIMDCMECGSCQFTCPSGRPLLDYVRLGKYKVGNIVRNRIKN